ncbi:exonuclease domain-containing protein [Microbacterium sp. YY-01]|uniref:exonuclease domain-containing protein n=1 Tax=Microbacterium sp. YY-01 TaxID=3421634 RepID=UPI003D16F74C
MTTSALRALPSWMRTVGVFDLETTGVQPSTDRIVTAYVGVLDHEGRRVSARHWLLDPGIEIPDAAAAVHGITTDHARSHGAAAAESVAEIVAALAELFAAGTPVVAYNAPFDFTLLHHEALRHGHTPLDSPGPIIDPLVVDKACDQYRRGKRTLALVAEHYGIELTNSHEASADAEAAGRVALALARAFPEQHDGDAHAFHRAQMEWARTQSASLTDYLIRVGRMAPGESVNGAWPAHV